MSLITTIIDGIAPNPSSGLGGANEGHIQGFQDDIINGIVGGVADKTGGQCLVTQNSPLGMSVLVANGVVYIPNSDYIANLATATKFYRVIIKDEDPVTIPSNTSGSDCQHGLDVVIDKDTVPNEYGSNIASLVVTLGTPGAGAPAVPDNGYRLAEVEVVNGATQIANVSIGDTRTQIAINDVVLSTNVVTKTATQTLTNKTLTSPVIHTPTGDVATITGSQTLTNKTLTSPAITTPKITTSINDANGNEVIKTPATTSAVNEITVTNAATGNAVQVSATGGDTNIDLKLVPKGTGALLDKNGDALAPNYSMARQAIINGNFPVWQRGTSFAITDATLIYSSDRFGEYALKDGGTLPTLTRTRVAQTPGDLWGSYYFSRLTTNGAGSSLGNSSQDEFFQRIENGTRTLCGLSKKVTISFYARSSIANKKIGVSMFQNYGSGGSPSPAETITGEAFTLTSSWVKYTHTFTTNTLVGKTFGTANDDYIEMAFWYQWGSTVGTAQGLGSAETYVGSGTIDIAQVQLCAGDVALPFQPKSYAQELLDCQRYTVDMLGGSALANIIVATGECNSATRLYASIQLPVTMRIAPTIVAGTASNFSVGYWTGANIACTAMSINIATPQMVLMNFDVAGGLTANYPARIFRPGTTEKLLITAEL